MPTVLIVHAHPSDHSFNHALKEVAVARFAEGGWDVLLSDLYAQRFQAVASKNDFTRPVSPDRFSLAHEQRHAQAERTYAPDILAEQDKVARADLIMFQFPLWWYSVPAILKGWIDRVLSNGFAYGDEQIFEKGLLHGKHAFVSMTTGASREELDKDRGYTGTVEQFLLPLTGGVLRFTGLTLVDPFIAYEVASVAPAGRKAILQLLESRIAQIAGTLASREQ